MDSEFWIKAWNEGRTNFHQGSVHAKLVEYFSQLNPQKGQRVLVPLCGKTQDLLWLHQLGLHVHGVELHEPAVQAFFAENKIPPPKVVRDRDFIHHTYENLTVSCGDFFKFQEKDAYDLVYDRAALVALPPDMRKGYSQIIQQSLKRAGKCLLIAYEYDPSQMTGPPFSVDEQEIRRLYGDQCAIRKVESQKPANDGPRLSAVETLKQTVYLLEKTPSS